MFSDELRKNRMSQLLEIRKSFKSFHVFAKQQFESQDTLPDRCESIDESFIEKSHNSYTLQPPYITINKKVIVAVCHKKSTAKLAPATCSQTADLNRKINTARKVKKSNSELQKRCKQQSATYVLKLNQLADSLRNLGLNKEIVKDVHKSAITVSHNLPILTATDERKPTSTLGSKKSAKTVPSIFKVGLKPVAQNQTTEPSSEPLSKSVPYFLCEKCSGKLQQVWCKANYNAEESVESEMLKNSICSDVKPLVRTSAGFENIDKFTASERSLPNSDTQTLSLKADSDIAVQVQIYQPVPETQFNSLDTLTTIATSIESIDTEIHGTHYEKINYFKFLKSHIMRCPINDCGILLSINDFVAHLYRAHNDLEKRLLLTGNEVCFKMIIYPKNSFQVAIILLKPVTDASYDINFPFVPIILMGQYVRDDDIDFFVIWLLGINNIEYTSFTMEIERGNRIHKRIQSTIFDVREQFTYQDILHSPKALVFNMDEIKDITLNGSLPFGINVRIL